MPTHWKKLTNPDYLGAYAFEPGEEKIGTIAAVREEGVVGMDGKEARCIVAHFAEKDMKPMVLNATNCKAITKLYKTPFIENWVGKKIVLRVQQARSFGEMVDSVRVKPEIPRTSAPPIACEECGQMLAAYGKMTVQQLAQYTKEKYGRTLCSECAKKQTEQTKPAEPAEQTEA